jgi:hypothetical protein
MRYAIPKTTAGKRIATEIGKFALGEAILGTTIKNIAAKHVAAAHCLAMLAKAWVFVSSGKGPASGH